MPDHGPDVTAMAVRHRLLGRDRERTVRYLLVAGVIVVVGLGLLYWRWSVTPRGTAWRLLGIDLDWVIVGGAVGPTALAGYDHDGLLAGWGLGAALPVAAYLRPVVVPAMAFDEPVVLGLATALALGMVVGTVGFGLGAGVRRLREWIGGSNRSVGS